MALSVANISLRTKENPVMKYIIPSKNGLVRLYCLYLLRLKTPAAQFFQKFKFLLFAGLTLVCPNFVLAEDESVRIVRKADPLDALYRMWELG